MYRLSWYREWWDIWSGLVNWKGLLIGALFSIPFFISILIYDPVFVKEEIDWDWEQCLREMEAEGIII